MLKKIVITLLCGMALALWAQVSVLSVVDEDKHTRKEDFWHTFEYYVLSTGGNSSKCQATRIAKNWFATAGHCVADACKNGCTLRMDLLEQPLSAFVDGKHTVKKPIVFIHPRYAENIWEVKYDFALIKMDLSLLPMQYYRRAAGKEAENVGVSRSTFENFLRKNPVARREFDRALRPELPPLLVFPDATKRIQRKLSVVSIFGGKRSIVQDPYPTDYVKELGFAYTQNFGVRKGMSGSGVMTNTGELAGIISGVMVLGTPDGDKTEDYFMFPVFNKELMEFMEETMGSDYYKMDRRDAEPNYVKRSPKSHAGILQAVRNAKKRK